MEHKQRTLKVRSYPRSRQVAPLRHGFSRHVIASNNRKTGVNVVGLGNRF